MRQQTRASLRIGLSHYRTAPALAFAGFLAGRQPGRLSAVRGRESREEFGAGGCVEEDCGGEGVYGGAVDVGVVDGAGG